MNKIEELETLIFALKMEVNSNYSSMSSLLLDKVITQRLMLKEEIRRLKKLEIRKLKIEKITNKII